MTITGRSFGPLWSHRRTLVNQVLRAPGVRKAIRNEAGDDPESLTRTRKKARNYALEIGASHYLGKPYDEDELLRLIAGYIKAKQLS